MAVTPTQTDYDLIQLKSRNSRVKIEVLNFDFQTISSLEERAVSGNIYVDATADIRRTCNISLIAKDLQKTMISSTGEIWIDK